jgi:hypothetical protein
LFILPFLALKAAKPKKSVLLKTGLVKLIGLSIFLSNLSIQFKKIADLNFVPIFDRFYRLLVKPTKPIRSGFLACSLTLLRHAMLLAECYSDSCSWQLDPEVVVTCVPVFAWGIRLISKY